MKNKIFLAIIVSVFAIAVAYLANTAFKMKPISDVSHLGGEFSLQGKQGEVKLSDFKGKVSILYFGFTTCPDVCPMALSHLRTKLSSLTEEKRNKIQTIFVSVDWKRDTPEKTQEYASFFGHNIVGLTGSRDEIDKVTRLYSVYYSFVDLEDSELGYTVDHTSRYFVIDGESKLVGMFSDVQNDPKFMKVLENSIGRL